MTKDNLKRANEIQRELDFIEDSLKKVEQISADEVNQEEAFIIHKSIQYGDKLYIPKGVFDTVVIMIGADLKRRKKQLEEEFEKL